MNPRDLEEMERRNRDTRTLCDLVYQVYIAGIPATETQLRWLAEHQEATAQRVEERLALQPTPVNQPATDSAPSHYPAAPCPEETEPEPEPGNTHS